jgi:hypothetical protein
VKPADVPKRILDELAANARSQGIFFSLSYQIRIEAGADYIDNVGRVLDGTQAIPETFGNYSVRFYDDIVLDGVGPTWNRTASEWIHSSTSV